MTNFKRGSRCSPLGDNRRQGTVYQINHKGNITFANVKWDDGIKQFRIPTTELSLEAPQEPQTNEVEQLSERIRQQQADRVDGYDRDDLGESHDY